jgi:hypothetical protein
MALLTWLEFPDYNTRLKPRLSASCARAESTWHSCSELLWQEMTESLSGAAGRANAIIPLKGITMR